jgi:hypothetical protein
MTKVRQFAEAGEAVARAMQSDPRYREEKSLEKEIEALEKKDELSAADEKRLEALRGKLEELQSKADAGSDDSNNQSLDDMVRAIEKHPALAQAIRGAGLTPREYSVLSLSIFQAMMAHGIQKSLGSKDVPKELAASVLAENIKFVADNEAEITRLMERVKSLDRKP